MRRRFRALALLPLLALVAPATAAAEPTWLPGQTVTYSKAFATDGFGLSFAMVQQRFSLDLFFRERPAGPAIAFADGEQLRSDATAEEQIVADGDGDLLASWTTSNYDLTFSERPRGGSWSAPVTLTTTARQVDVDLAATGAAAAAWNDDAAVHATWRTGPSTWATPVELSPSMTGAPKVAVAPDGAVTVVWLQPHPDHGSVAWQRTKPAGSGTFAAAQRLSSGPHPTDESLDDGHAHAPSVDIGPNGRAFAAWSQDAGYCTDHALPIQCPGGGAAVERIEYAERAPDATSFGPIQETAVGELDQSETPSLAVGADGSVSMTYRRDLGWNGIPNDPEENALVALTRPAGGSGFTRQVLTQQGSGHELVAGHGGHVYVAWAERPPNADEVTRVALRRPGAGAFEAVPGSTALRGNSGFDLFVSREGDLLHWNGPLEVLDVAAPRVTTFTAPAEVHAGSPATLSVDAVDTWSALDTIEWELPGGATAEGAEIEHTFTDTGEQDVTITVTDEHGNATERTETVTVAEAPDVQDPAVEITSPADGQRVLQGEDVRADYACTDDRELDTCTGPVASGERIDTATLGTKSFTVVARDKAGNEAEVTHEYVVDAVPDGDAASPTIEIRTPRIGQRFTQGQVVRADFSCTDDRVVTSCEGTTADGARLDTSRVGQFSLRVVAKDAAGHETSRLHGYFVDPAPAPAPPKAAPPKPPSSSPPLSEIIRREAERNGGTAPGGIGGGSLLDKDGFSQEITGTEKDQTVIGKIAGSPVVSAGGGNVISAGGGNVISAGGGNVISAGGGNVVSAGGGNFAPRASAAGAKDREPTLFGEGGHTFRAPGTATLEVKLTKDGRRALADARRKARRDHRRGKKVKDLEVFYTVFTGFPDGRTPAYATTKALRIDLVYRFVQTRGSREGLGYNVIRHRNGKRYRHYENKDVVLKR